MERKKIIQISTDPIAPGQRLMNEKDAADYLGWSVKTLQARRHLCKPPRYRKIGRSVRYVPADLEAFVESCAVEPQA